MCAIWKMELRKMLHSRAMLCAVLIGVAVCSVNIVENYVMRRWFYGVAEIGGYATLSIFQNWIDGMGVTVGEEMFFMMFPMLAALPFAWSPGGEIRAGYACQLLVRGKKGSCYFVKYTVVFLSGGLAVTIPMVFNFIVNAWILPACAPAYEVVGGGDGIYLAGLLFTRPMLYLPMVLFTAFCWAGLLACMGLAVNLFVRNALAAVISPFLVFYGIEALTYATVKSSTRFETSPMKLLHAMTLNWAPAWYVWTVIAGAMALVTVIYSLRVMRCEIY